LLKVLKRGVAYSEACRSESARTSGGSGIPFYDCQRNKKEYSGRHGLASTAVSKAFETEGEGRDGPQLFSLNYSMDTIIETDRIILRKFVAEDFMEVFAFNSNTEVQKYTGDELVETPERAKQIITDIVLKDYKDFGYGRWAVVHKADDKVIGFAGLKYIPKMDVTDIGFRFLPAYWGKGIATEVSIPILKYGFEELELQSIVGIAMPENIGSCRVLEKIGLQFYKIDGYEGDGGKYRWYKLDRDDYISSV